MLKKKKKNLAAVIPILKKNVNGGFVRLSTLQLS
jgi:hypothetical protein